MKAIKITLNIPIERVQDLLCDALEGGSNYWCEIKSYNYPAGETKKSLNIKFQHLEIPFKGGSLTIRDTEEEADLNLAKKKGCADLKTKLNDKILNLQSITKGLQIMANKEPRHFADFMQENDDADTGDVFLQCCLFKEVIYG
jgi:hypothetical protein